jgi:adhesin HecA-like repeat protein
MTERFALRHARTLPLRLMTISLAALLATSASHAQTLPTPDREEQRRRAQAQSQERQQQRAPRIDLQENPPSAGDADASPLPAEPLCFRIDQVGLDTPPHLPPDVRRLGVYALPQDPFHFAHLYLQRYAGQCIGREGAGLIVRRLTRRILERGYTTTRIGIPEQDLSSGVQVNGELWATQLNVITGSNQVRYADLGVQVIQGDGDKPTVGIDVAQLGGMYANKIRLIGTEAGVGVRGLGGIAALAGDLGIDSQGKVTLNGSTYATGNIAIAATDGVANAGTLYGQQAVTLNSQGQIGNSGTIAAQGDLTLTGGSIESTGALAAGLDQHGQIGQTGHLAVTASGTLAATGYHLGAGNVALQGASLDLSGATTLANGNIALRAAGCRRRRQAHRRDDRRRRADPHRGASRHRAQRCDPCRADRTYRCRQHPHSCGGLEQPGRYPFLVRGGGPGGERRARQFPRHAAGAVVGGGVGAGGQRQA